MTPAMRTPAGLAGKLASIVFSALARVAWSALVGLLVSVAGVRVLQSHVPTSFCKNEDAPRRGRVAYLRDASGSPPRETSKSPRHAQVAGGPSKCGIRVC